MATNNEISNALGNARDVMFGDGVETGGKNAIDHIVDLMDTMDARLMHIELYVKKIDAVQASISSLVTKVDTLEAQVKSVSTNQRELESSVQGVSNLFDNIKASCDTNKKDITQIKCSIVATNSDNKDMRTEFVKLRKECEEMRSTITDLQCLSMKNNLIFNGLVENSNENTEDVLRDFIYQELRIDQDIEFGNVHRFGRRRDGNRRPIIARFIFFKQLTQVKSKAYMLKDKPYSINEQFPGIIEGKRKQLYPVAKRFRQAGRKTKLVRDKLFVDGKLHDSNSPQNDTHRQRDSRQGQANERKTRPTPKRARVNSSVSSDQHSPPAPCEFSDRAT